MRDAKSVFSKYAVVLVFWLIPVVLILVPLLYPTQGSLRDILVLPVILVLLYVAILLSPLFRPLRNIDFFDDIPDAIERYVDEQRARKDARDLIKLYVGGHLPNVYELTNLTPFQRQLAHTLELLKNSSEWHASNAEVSRDIVDRLETLMRATETEEQADEPARPARKKSGKRR